MYECPDFKEHRYQQTMLQAITIIPSSQTCLPVPNHLKYVCESTCVTAQESLKALFDSNQCSSTPSSTAKQYRDDILAIYDNMCQTLATVTQDTCMTAVQSESYTCGYSSIEQAANYCSTANDSCCSLVPETATMNTNLSNATVTPAATSDFFKSNTFYIILGIVLGLLVMSILLVVCLRRRKKRVKQYILPKNGTQKSFAPTIVSKVSPVLSSVSNPATNETYVVKFAYAPALLDELALNPGDYVTIFEIFDDGWAMGKNMNTKKEGIFPMASVAPANSTSPNMTKKSPEFRASSLYGRYKQ